ncbi:enhancer of mRNA-decapping protein [Anaeramoeba flamelloides]|uniref:Enhancer of mRNA-decapping protein n=1 Tax=Anaeramoeba flamelloides TaxID=1746091 RepID=A0ABQ8X9Q8_9EUKA|nr:enhancer of mRNA-decapping protein [Anaeramoeba flamelloides]
MTNFNFSFPQKKTETQPSSHKPFYNLPEKPLKVKKMDNLSFSLPTNNQIPTVMSNTLFGGIPKNISNVSQGSEQEKNNFGKEQRKLENKIPLKYDQKNQTRSKTTDFTMYNKDKRKLQEKYQMNNEKSLDDLTNSFLLTKKMNKHKINFNKEREDNNTKFERNSELKFQNGGEEIVFKMNNNKLNNLDLELDFKKKGLNEKENMNFKSEDQEIQFNKRKGQTQARVKKEKILGITSQQYQELFAILSREIIKTKSELYAKLFRLIEQYEKKQLNKFTTKKPVNVKKQTRKMNETLFKTIETTLEKQIKENISNIFKETNLQNSIDDKYFEPIDELQLLLKLISGSLIELFENSKEINDQTKQATKNLFIRRIIQKLNIKIKERTINLFNQGNKENFNNQIIKGNLNLKNKIIRPQFEKQFQKIENTNQKNASKNKSKSQSLEFYMGEQSTIEFEKLMKNSTNISNQILDNLKVKKIKGPSFIQEKIFIENLLKDGKQIQAFQEIFKIKKPNLSIWLCSKINPDFIFENSILFNQTNILFLIRSLSSNLKIDSKIKFSWLTNCFLNTDLDKHISKLRKKLFKKLKKMNDYFQNDHNANQEFMILFHILNSLK